VIKQHTKFYMKYYLPTIEFHIYPDSQQSRHVGNFQQGKDPYLCMDNILNKKIYVTMCEEGLLALEYTITISDQSINNGSTCK